MTVDSPVTSQRPRIAIARAGRVGTTLASLLASESADVVALKLAILMH
jgi:hypothetical protein